MIEIKIEIQKSKIQMLSVTDLEVCYGSISALRGISFNIPQGAIVTLTGLLFLFGKVAINLGITG